MKINLLKVEQPRPKINYRKTIFLMKLSLFFYLVFCFQLIAFNGFSQETITLDVKNNSLESILQKIEEQTSYNFILNNDVIDVHQKFSITVTEKEATKTLAQLFKNSGINYKIKKNHIILSKRKKTFTISGIVRDITTGETLLGANITIKSIQRGVVSNAYGFYSISLPKGSYLLEISYLGYTCLLYTSPSPRDA